MPGFIQIIEFTTTRIDEVKALSEQLRESSTSSTVVRGTVSADRDRPNTYLNLVEFDSYEAAMENSGRPETTEFSQKMSELCDGPPIFRNLDVMESW